MNQNSGKSKRPHIFVLEKYKIYKDFVDGCDIYGQWTLDIVKHEVLENVVGGSAAACSGSLLQ